MSNKTDMHKSLFKTAETEGEELLISELLFEHAITKQIFNALRAHVVRSRAAITVVFLGLCNESEFGTEKLPEAVERITDFLKNKT